MGPIRGQTRPVPVEAGVVPAQQLDAKLNASIHNRFDVEVVDAATGEIKQRAQAENVICNQLWTRLFTPNTYFNFIHYGSGTGTPAATDTSLFTFVGYLSFDDNDTYNNDSNTGVVSLRRKTQILESVSVGSVISEIGIAYDTSAASLCTHAMLKDMNGNQISITKTGTDIINIYATIFVHYSSAGYDGGTIHLLLPNDMTGFYTGVSSLVSWLLKGTSFSEGSHYWRWLGTALGTARGAYNSYISDSTSSNSQVVFNKTNKTLTLLMNRLAAADSNLAGGYRCIELFESNYVYDTHYFQMLALKVGGAWFSGSTITGEAIGTGDGFTKDFATAFNYPENAKIFVNGAEVTNVTIDAVPVKISSPGQGLNAIEAYYDFNSSCSPCVYVDNLSNTNKMTTKIGTHTIYYNELYEYGIKSLDGGHTTLEVSNDLVTWVPITIAAAGSITQIPTEYQHFKYWKFTAVTSTTEVISSIVFADMPTTTNIHFATAPASGAVITANYTTPTIAKDANHVFDLAVTIQLGEYTG